MSETLDIQIETLADLDQHFPSWRQHPDDVIKQLMKPKNFAIITEMVQQVNGHIDFLNMAETFVKDRDIVEFLYNLSNKYDRCDESVDYGALTFCCTDNTDLCIHYIKMAEQMDEEVDYSSLSISSLQQNNERLFCLSIKIGALKIDMDMDIQERKKSIVDVLSQPPPPPLSLLPEPPQPQPQPPGPSQPQSQSIPSIVDDMLYQSHMVRDSMVFSEIKSNNYKKSLLDAISKSSKKMDLYLMHRTMDALIEGEMTINKSKKIINEIRRIS